MAGKRNWVVNIAVEDSDPATYGPYVEATARTLAEQFNTSMVDYPVYIHATAYPIQPLRIRAMVKEFGDY